MTENNVEMLELMENNNRDNRSEIDNKLSWCNLLTQFGRRSTSIENGCLICLCALNIHFNYIFNDTSSDINDLFGSANYLLWYLGTIVGCIICGSNRNTWPIRKANIIMAFSLLFAGTLICLNHSIWDEAFYLIAIARFVGGFCFGFAHITTIVQISDNIWKDIRGCMSTTLAIIPLFAILIITIKPDIDTDDDRGNGTIQHNAMPNILMMTLIILTIFNTFKPTFESIACYLKSANIDVARNALTELWQNLIEPTIIDNEIDDKLKMISEDFAETLSFREMFENGNWKAIWLMVLLKLLAVYTSNLFLFRASIIIMSKCILKETEIVLAILVMRFTAILPARYGLDRWGRRRFLLVSGLCTGCISLFVITIFTPNHNNEENNNTIYVAYVLMHIFAACGIEPVAHTISTEAFPLSKRNASIAFITCFECICDGSMMFFWSLNEPMMNSIVLRSMPFALISITLMSYSFLPETMGKSMRQCRAKFNEYYETSCD